MEETGFWGRILIEAKAKLYKAIGPAFAGIFILVATIFVVYYWYFPIAQYFLDDEWFVLPERVWYPDIWDWLRHLLFFPQTRNVWVGDHMLVRPGLFFWIWCQDVFLRSHREAQQLVLIAVALFSSTSLYMMIYRETGKFLAGAACLFAFASLPGTLLYTWPHINGYLFALAFYTFAMGLYSSDKITATRSFAIAVLLFMAESFHEFVALTLVLVFLVEFFCWRRKDPRASSLRLKALMCALGAYGLVCAFAWIYLRPPAVFAPTEVDSWHLSVEYIYHVFFVQGMLLLGILNDLIPLHLHSPTPIELPLLMGGILIALGFLYRDHGNREFQRKIVLCLLPVLALLIGLFLGRVATRGVVKIHYYPMFQFFLVMALALVAASVRTVRGIWILALSIQLILSSIHSVTFLGDTSEARGPVASTLGSVNGLLAYLREHEDHCYAGLYDPWLRGDLNKAVNIALTEWQCAWKKSTPAYFLVNEIGEVTEIKIPAVTGGVTRLDSGLGLASQSRELAPYLANLTYNFQEEARQLRHDGLIQLRSLYEKINAQEISARFHGEDPFPQLFNVGLRIQGERQTHFIVLLDNVLRVLVKDESGTLKEFSQSQIPEFKAEFSLRAVRTNEGCMVFLDDQLLTQTGKCLDGPVAVGTFTIENGTEPERLIDLHSRD